MAADGCYLEGNRIATGTSNTLPTTGTQTSSSTTPHQLILHRTKNGYYWTHTPSRLIQQGCRLPVPSRVHAMLRFGRRQRFDLHVLMLCFTSAPLLAVRRSLSVRPSPMLPVPFRVHAMFRQPNTVRPSRIDSAPRSVRRPHLR